MKFTIHPSHQQPLNRINSNKAFRCSQCNIQIVNQNNSLTDSATQPCKTFHETHNVPVQANGDFDIHAQCKNCDIKIFRAGEPNGVTSVGQLACKVLPVQDSASSHNQPQVPNISQSLFLDRWSSKPSASKAAELPEQTEFDKNGTYNHSALSKTDSSLRRETTGRRRSFDI